MACKFKDECPCGLEWCESETQDYEKCIPFILIAYEAEKGEKERLRKENLSWALFGKPDEIKRIIV